MSNAELIDRLRGFEVDHNPLGWPAIRMRDISALCNALEAADKRIAELEADRDTWKERAEFSYQERSKLERKLAVARDALLCWKRDCSFAEPSLSLAMRKTDEALAQIGGEDAT